MDCQNLINSIYIQMRDQVEWEYYNNYRRSPREVLAEKKANCVDRAFTIDTILWCQYQIKSRFVYARVITETSSSGHVWPQIFCNGKYIDCDANNPNFQLGQTYNIEKIYAILPDLKVFGCPPVKCEAIT